MASSKLAVVVASCALMVTIFAAPAQAVRPPTESAPRVSVVAAHPQHSPPGVPKRWCHRHPRKCDRIRHFVHGRVAQFRHRTVDKVRYRTIPRKVRRMAIHAYNVTYGGGCSVCKRDDGSDWFSRWVSQADCVRHGYGCYPTVNGPAPELSKAEKVILWCSATVVVTRVPGAQTFLQLGSASSGCFWGAVGYLGWIWGR